MNILSLKLKSIMEIIANTNDAGEANNQDLEIKIRNKIAELDRFADEMPSVIIVHNMKTHAVEYMSPRGRKILGVSLEELKSMGTEYYTRFFNPEDAKDYVPRIFSLLERNSCDEIISFYQQVRASEAYPWSWYFSTTKIFLRDEEGLPILTITQAYPVDESHNEACRAERLHEEENFIKNNLSKFVRLSYSETEVLRLLALGKSAVETARELSISDATVEAHRRNIKKKLETDSFYELTQYARAFDLVKAIS